MFNISRMIKRQLAVLILLPLLMGGAVFAYTKFLIVPMYTATATIVVAGKKSEQAGMQYDEIMASQALAKSVMNIAQSREIAGEVSETLHEKWYDQMKDSPPVLAPVPVDPAIAPDNLMKSLKVTVLPNTCIVSIEYVDSSSERAAEVANQYSAVLSAKVPGYFNGVVVSPLDSAFPSSKPSSPNSLFNTLAGLLAGLIAAIIWAYVYEYFTNRDNTDPATVDKRGTVLNEGQNDR